MVYLTIATDGPGGREVSLAALKDASQVDPTVRAVLAARVRQAAAANWPAPERWATISTYPALGSNVGELWAVEVDATAAASPPPLPDVP